MTSEVLAKVMSSNPVVIRRVMAGLRDRGYVQSEKGHGGGWTLACGLSKVTLRDIYIALGAPSLLAIGNRTETPGCLVEEAVNTALNKSFRDAEALLLSRLGEVTLAKLSADVRHRLAVRGHSHPPGSAMGKHGSDHGGRAHDHAELHDGHGGRRPHEAFACRSRSGEPDGDGLVGGAPRPIRRRRAARGLSTSTNRDRQHD